MSFTFRKIYSLLALVLIPGLLVFAEPVNKKSGVSQMLPEKVGSFRARGQAGMTSPGSAEALSNFDVVSQANRLYISVEGESFLVEVFSTRSYSGAYALLTRLAWGKHDIKRNVVGTAAILEPRRISFFKGANLVRIDQTSTTRETPEKLLAFARTLADNIDGGDNDIPVLVRHLPTWESVQERVFYVTSSYALKVAIPNQPIINDLTFDGGSEAALAQYGTPRLLLVEFNTPQIAGENDQRIAARIQELRSQGQPVPTAYRRVGNYAVFVFDAPSELAANQLIDQVKYQQVVQWLGKNPYSYREAVAEFTQTTLGVLVSVVKASGIVLLGSLVVGGFFGALLFSRRRSQQRVSEEYSDGVMVRLNLDEVNTKTDPARLMGP